MTITIARVYDPPAPGRRFLVERLWPRGLRRDQVDVEAWLKEVAPSPELRKWYGHEPERWPEFQTRYVGELVAHPETWQPLLDAARAGDDLVLVYAARDTERNSAHVLRDFLLERLAE